jgi:hypothetical protein
MKNVLRGRIKDLVAAEYPIAVIARRIGIWRQDVYNYLEPTRHSWYRLSDEKLRLIAEFEGRSLRAVRAEYESRAEAA